MEHDGALSNKGGWPRGLCILVMRCEVAMTTTMRCGCDELPCVEWFVGKLIAELCVGAIHQWLTNKCCLFGAC